MSLPNTRGSREYAKFVATTDGDTAIRVIVTGEGPVVNAIATKINDYTLLSTDYTILVDASSNTVDITLPAAPISGQGFIIKAIDSSFTVTVDRNGKLIDNAASDLTLTATNSVMLQYSSTYGWATI